LSLHCNNTTVIASLACTLAPSIEWLIAGRFAQALGCCAGMVVARAVVRDRYDHRDSARIFSLLVLVLAVAPLVAPTVGGWLAMAFSWRAVFFALAMFGTAVGIAVWFRLDESRSAETEAKARGESVIGAYRDLLRTEAARRGWRYAELGDAAPNDHFTDTDFHLTAQGTCQYAQRLEAVMAGEIRQ
jgi:MFS family permease